MSDLIIGLVIVAILAATYLLPTIVAFHRGTPNRYSVAVVNVAFGWTALGWIIALAMAVAGARPRMA